MRERLIDIVRDLRGWFAADLRRRLMGTLGLVMVLLSVLFLTLVLNTYRNRLLSEQERAAGRFNGLLQASLENAMLKRDLHGLQAILADIGQAPGILGLQVLNPAFEVRFASDPEAVGTSLDSPAMRELLTGVPGTTRILSADGDALRAVTAVPNQPPCHDCHGSMADHPVNGLLAVDYDAADLGRDARRGAMTLAGMGSLVVFATTLTAWWALSRTVLRPVGALSAAMETLHDGNYRNRVEARGEDEISRLGQGFNRMADRLEESFAALHRSEERLQAVIDAIPDGIRVIGSDYRVVMVNAAYARSRGEPPERLIGKPCHVLSHRRATPCPVTLVRCPLAELGPSRPTITCRQIHAGPGQGETHVEVAAAFLDSGARGSGVSVVEAIRDLDQQAQLGQEHRLAELGMMAAGLAHEIFNPLSSINLVISALEHDLPAGGRAAVRPHLDTLLREINRTLELTHSLMTLCQPPGEAVLLTVAEVIPQTLEILRFEARKAGAKLSCELPGDLRLLVAESDLRLAVTNLVQNALHAVGREGEVRVSARRVAGRVRLTVSDNGRGIAPEDIARVTLPFWTRRADGTQGRGLGLTLVQAAMDRAGGRLEIDSSPGKGSRFTLDFPDPDRRGGVEG